MPRFVLIAAYVAWPSAVVLLRLVTPVRRLCLVVHGGAWLAAVVVATTAAPATRAVPAGLITGGVLGLGVWLAVSRGLSFTWDQQRTYWAYDGTIPGGEWVILALAGAVGVLGVIGLA